QAGENFFFDENKVVDTAFHCNGCHIVDREANAGSTDKPGFFGTDGKNTFAFIQQFLKVPHLRNMYNKVGMFGMVNNRKYLADDIYTGMENLPAQDDPEFFNAFFNHVFFGNENQHMGDQIKGFGYTQEGSADTVFRFHNTIGFLPRAPGSVTPLDPGSNSELGFSPESFEIRRNLEQYLMVFPTNFFPIMGQQITLSDDNAGDDEVNERISLMMERAELGECDLVVRSKADNGYLYQGGNSFLENVADKQPISEDKLRSKVGKGSALTFTCAAPGTGMRLALDRNNNGVLDGDE
ncbi:hypothetical protein, partial [Kaarinaea lacus]